MKRTASGVHGHQLGNERFDVYECDRCESLWARLRENSTGPTVACCPTCQNTDCEP
jgi:hypothetical protein